MSATAAASLAGQIASLAARLERPVALMEVCGTHTMAIHRHGIRSLLPPNIRLISGPGCPVCVTPASAIDRMLWLSDGGTATPGGQSMPSQPIIATFGDMIRVPGSTQSLQQARSQGADVRTLYSPMEAVQWAAEAPRRQVIFLGVGFETTVPGIAAAVVEARRRGLENFSVAAAFKTVPRALEALLSSPRTAIDGLLCPGHVSVIIGSEVYEDVARRFGVPCVVAGFEGLEILDAVARLLEQLAGDGAAHVENRYAQWVKPQGNARAREMIERVFEPCDAEWRGLGVIAGSGLALRPEFARFDAFARFHPPAFESSEPQGCLCGEVLQGAAEPAQCGLFGRACTPEMPVGPCMVSSEGACAAAFKYGAE